MYPTIDSKGTTRVQRRTRFSLRVVCCIVLCLRKNSSFQTARLLPPVPASRVSPPACATDEGASSHKSTSEYSSTARASFSPNMPLEGRPTQRRTSQQSAPPPPFWKNLVAGGGAGLLEIMCMYPTDVSALLAASSRG